MKGGLGKGLSALLGEDVVSNNANREFVKIININDIEPDEDQPRRKFEYDKVKELSDSISAHGLLQPIVVRLTTSGKYQIIAGERRWRACKLAKLRDIPVVIKEVTIEEGFELALIENIQREGLSIIEEAEGFAKLVDEFGYTNEKIAEKISKSRSHVANILRLNQLPQSIKDLLNNGLLSMGHARCLINHPHADLIADSIIKDDLSVRQTEQLVKNWSKVEYSQTPDQGERVGKEFLKKSNNNKDSDLKLLAKSLSEKLNVKVTIEDYTIGGKLIFHYSNLEELDSILSRIN